MGEVLLQLEEEQLAPAERFGAVTAFCQCTAEGQESRGCLDSLEPSTDNFCPPQVSYSV